MLCSTQRMGIRFCLNDNGTLVDAKNSLTLSANCRVCGNAVSRKETFQLFQHSDNQCDHLVLSEVCERLSNLISEQKKLALPINYSCTKSIDVEIAHNSLLVDNNTRPLIELTLTDNQNIYLTITLEDSETDEQQILELRQRFESVIEVNLSGLTIPSSDFTYYLRDSVLNNQFHQLCKWLAFNPLYPLTRNIASIEADSILNKRQIALDELSKVEERIKTSNSTLERISRETITAQDNLQLLQSQKYNYDLNRNIDSLKSEESNLLTEISKLKQQRSELLSGSTTASLNYQLNELRSSYASGKQHIEQQKREKNRLTTQIDRLKQQKESIQDEIQNAKWLRSILTRFDCTFDNIENELSKIVQISESYIDYENRAKLAQNKLTSLEEMLEKKRKELDEEKKGVEFYKKEKFRMFKDNQQLKTLVENGNV
ncbi:hypothetical protein [Photobacterium damselae]|uniref:hypothetical protein n=1 Tax=Photobacterium damselae TaxID=38293 RepID=UPI0010FD6DA3|nr:hypothetical protein [Photobacterium damselae]TLS80212.1 hypothetical protein FD721_01775 [Photobacterium damselae subsp. damselae]TLS89894.1 hypothetical protein FD720_01005 [Photobacterium damselae subsp. damselae]